MGVYEGRGQLHKALKELMLRWHETKLSWTDVMAEQFEKEQVLPLESDMKTAVSAMDHMANVLHQVRRDCE
jgi:hypothetical protein